MNGARFQSKTTMAAGIVSHKGDVIGAGSMEGLAGQRRAS